MDNKPMALSREEMKEIAAIEDIQQMWGAEDAAEMEEFFDAVIYAAKFDFVSGATGGYAGDLYVLFGDAPGQPVRLIRVNGKLQFLDFV
jgi:hypothetical protein